MPVLDRDAGRAAILARVPPGADLEALRRAADGCTACPLGVCGRVVFGEGPATARLVLVGEQPGDHEERVGRPFVGPAGALLDRALQAAGVGRDEVYVTNAVKHFKHEVVGRRRLHQRPSTEEVQVCGQWLELELDRLRPVVVLALGATAARALIGHPVVLREARGKDVGRVRGAPLRVTWHPSAALRAREGRQALVDDLVADLVAARRRLRGR